MTLDASKIVQSLNEAAALMFGAAATDLLGQPISQFLEWPVKDARNDHPAALIGDTSGRGSRFEVRGLRKDGSTFPAEIAINYLQLGTQQ
jgi:PAS domain S-box-containing protein